MIDRIKYDDGLQKAANGLRTSKRDEEVLELSYEETRRSPVQIGAAPPPITTTRLGEPH